MNQISSGATGPRTAEGKRRTRYNAAKYGIFSKVILIGNESYTDLELILKGLHEQYRPETTLERILVDKLATLLWRYRRLLIAETAEIQFSINFPKLDANGGEKKFVEILVKYDGNEPRNLIKQAHDPVALDRCLDLLRALKNGIEASGFDTNRDSTILIKLYGDLNKSGKTPNLFSIYRAWVSRAVCPEEERKRSGFPSPEHCKAGFLDDLMQEIAGLECRKMADAEEWKLDRLRRCVPPLSPEHLLRCETSLERNIERTFAQLERLQRIRLGQPVLPPINLNVSSS